MKRISFIAFIIGPLLGFLAGCATVNQRWEKADASTRSEFLLRQHFATYAKGDHVFPLGNLGWTEASA